MRQIFKWILAILMLIGLIVGIVKLHEAENVTAMAIMIVITLLYIGVLIANAYELQDKPKNDYTNGNL